MKLLRLFATLLLGGTATATFCAAPAEFNQEGLMLSNQDFVFCIPYPAVNDKAPAVEELKPDAVRLAYPDGNRLTATIEGNACSYKLEKKPNKLSTKVMIPMSFCTGGSWELGGRKGTFPGTLGETFLFSGHSPSFTLNAPSGQKTAVKMQAYYQLQDNRKWQWNIFLLHAALPTDQSGKFSWEFENQEKAKVLIDRFGQLANLDFPGKVKSEEEIKSDLERDRQFYGSFRRPDVDQWGGLPGSGEKLGLRKTGFFHLEKHNDRDMLVDPEGNLYFQIGVCVIGHCDDYTYVTGREHIYEWIPPMDGDFSKAFLKSSPGKNFSFYIANYIRKTGKPYSDQEWSDDIIGNRLRPLGFNSHGSFSGSAGSPDNFKYGFAVCPVMRIDQWRGFNMLPGVDRIFDPFDPANVKALDALLKNEVAPYADSADVIGYFSSPGEINYRDIPRKVAEARDTPAKKEFVDLLEKKYRDISTFNSAWKTRANNFAELVSQPLQATTDDALRDLGEYEAHFLNAYFKLIAETFRKYDPNHLYLGERFLSSEAYREIPAKACGRYADAFSIDHYAAAGELDPANLERWATLSGRPVLLTEWGYGSAEQGQFGIRNVKDQAAQGAAYRSYLENAAASPHVIGVHWFQLLDQSITGRFYSKYNGESMNCGLFNVADRPYRILLTEAAKANYSVYDLILGNRKPAVRESAPQRGPRLVQAAHILPGYRLDGSFQGYANRPPETIDHSVEGKNPSSDDKATFQCGWDEQNLYIAVQVHDKTPGQNPANRPADLWTGDGVELFIGTDLPASGELRRGDRQLIVGAKTGTPFCWYNCMEQRNIDAVLTVSGDRKGYVLEFAVPWDAIGVTKPVSGLKLRFDLLVDFGFDKVDNRLNQLAWSGRANNNACRNLWGTLVLVP